VKIEEYTAAELTTSHKALMEEFQGLRVYLPEIDRELPGVLKGIMDAHQAGRLTREQALLEAYISPSMALASIDDRLEHRMASYMKKMIALGRRMADMREEMGEQNFKDALARACPEVPWKYAEFYMRGYAESRGVWPDDPT
jgi:hypothetical protein